MFSLDLNVPSESLSITVLGREFQMVAFVEQRNARLANAVLANSLFCATCRELLTGDC